MQKASLQKRQAHMRAVKCEYYMIILYNNSKDNNNANDNKITKW